MRVKSKEQARKNFELEAEYTRTRLKMNVIKCAMIQGKTSLDDAIVYDPDDEEWEKMIVFSKHPFYDWIIGEKPLMDGFEEGFTRDLENYKKIRAKIDPKTGKFPRNDEELEWEKIIKKIHENAGKLAKDFL